MENNILKDMGERIYQRRKMLKLTQEELAEKMDVSTQMISNLELGKKAIRPENLIKLCKALSISVDFILTGVTYSYNPDSLNNKLSKLNANELKIINDLIDYMTYNK